MKKIPRTAKVRLSPIWQSEGFLNEFNCFQNGQACSPVKFIIVPSHLRRV